MKIRRIIAVKAFVWAILFCSFLYSPAQNVDFKSRNFPDQKKELRIAKSSYRKGNTYFEKALKYCRFLKKYFAETETYCAESRYFFDRALPFYLEAQEFNPYNAELNFKLGICFFHRTEKSHALQYFYNADSLDPSVNKRLHFFLGRSFHYNHQFEEAIKNYELQINDLHPKREQVLVDQLNRRISECKNGIEIIKEPLPVMITNPGNSINTLYPEYSAVISADERKMFFTSRRPSGSDVSLDSKDNLYFENIFQSRKSGILWEEALPLPKKINKADHNGVSGITPDALNLFVYKANSKNGDIFGATYRKSKWSNPAKLSNKVSSRFRETIATVSADRRTMYFVSDRKGGLGGMDIYACDLDEWGKVSNVRNMGDQINSDADEIFVHLAADAKTLYFCSNGHNTIGGYDIFVSRYVNGFWSKAANIGYPLNTASDEISFSARADGTVAYIASNREGSYGDYDVFRISYSSNEKPLLLNTNDLSFIYNKDNSRNIIQEPSISILKTKVWLFKGTISDVYTGAPIEAEIEIVDNRSRSVISHFHSNADDGSFLIILAPGNNYALTMEADRYLFHSENFFISYNAEYKELYENIRMKPFSSGEKIVLSNVFFKGNTASLEQESFFELERLGHMLNDDHPYMKIEIGAHTDNQNPEDFSKLLSEKRAASVANYLIDYLKVPAERIEIKGYGYRYPLASNETEEGRRQNNRIELKIIDME